MCLAIPAKVVSVAEHTAEVDLMGNSRLVNIDLVAEELNPGDFVLVHAGFALERLDSDTARETLALLEEVASKGDY